MPEESLAAGTRLGAFEVIRLLGHGGMGAVYEVRNVLTEKRLALKVILPAHLADAESRARFLREVRIAAALDHPNVVRVFEPALHGDTMLLPMELVEGVTLRQHLTGEDGRARRLSVEETVGLLAQVCEGVAAVHAKGVIHRDLKPANVMVVREARGGLVAKVPDFGAARHVDKHDEHTREGLALGTPPYMAPEQLAAAPDLDPRVDVYALGVIAYESLVGQRPHGGSGGSEVMAKVLTRVPFPRPRVHRPELPDALDDAVMRTLAFARDERTPSARALREELLALTTLAPPGGRGLASDFVSAELVVERPTPATPTRPSRSPLRAAGALGALAVLLVTLTVALRARRAVPPMPEVRDGSARVVTVVAVAEVPVVQSLRIDAGTRSPHATADAVEGLGVTPAALRAGGGRAASSHLAEAAAMGALTRVSLAILLPATLHAQDRRCAGSDPAAAERARTRATTLLEANLGRSRVNVAALREVVREATAACEAGDARALFHRALAREALAETHLAARDLDAFLLREPMRGSDPFVRALRERLDARVGRVGVIRAGSVGARVQIDGTVLDDDERALAVSPGEVRVRVDAEGFVPVAQTVRVAVGTLVAIAVRRDDEAPRATPEIVLRRVPAPSQNNAEPRAVVPAHPLRPWAIAASATAGAALALGIGMLVWRTSSASTYSGLGCEGMSPASAACLDTYAQFRDANAAALATLVSAGVLAVTAGALWFVDLRRSRARSWTCAPGVAGVGCAVRF
jgi:tRNA A-37 threonylcarbamoyl transferase component Bud32